MNIIKPIFLVSFLSFVSLISYAQPLGSSCHKNPGMMICRGGTVGSITNSDGLFGLIVLENEKVIDRISSSAGAMEINNSEVNIITETSTGKITLSNSTVKQGISGRVGEVYASNSSVGDISGAIPLITLSGTDAGNIDLSSGNGQKLYLKNGSTVNGRVSYANQGAIVCIDSTSSIRGNVSNATITHNCA